MLCDLGGVLLLNICDDILLDWWDAHTTKAARKIVIIGDSHTRGLANSLNSVLNSENELLNLLKPGAGSDSLKESLTETVHNLTKEDVVVISCGTNDMNQNNFNYTYINIKDYLLTLKNTKVLVLGIPFRYDLQKSKEINSKIGNIIRNCQN